MNTKEDVEPLPDSGFYQLFPGVYCKDCESVFALYSYSAHKHDGIDDKGRAFYNKCYMCDPKLDL